MSNIDIEIARNAVLEPIETIAGKLDIPLEMLEPYGHTKAKISFDMIEHASGREPGKLILVTAISPTPAGEGKTTTSIGLCDGLNRIGKRASVCLREPSLGPCFGIKGGAAGGGYSQVVPMEDINLHFTGDLHAITSANNLLGAMLDNHLHHGNRLGIDVRKVAWHRVVDLNDRALRRVVLGLGGPAGSVPRESSFDITVASEVMAIFCLSESLMELKERLGNIIIAYDKHDLPVRAADIKANGAMTVLLRDALKPNLVQTLEGNPALVHGGPFANIAHGCNSLVATKLSMRLSDYTITEAGFGADLGAEKFFDIKCRKSDLKPDLVVLVATVRALKLHGGVALAELDRPDIGALRRGACNLEKHIENLQLYGVPVVVAINVFPNDTKEELELLKDICTQKGVMIESADHWANGGRGAEKLAQSVIETLETEKSDFRTLYPDSMHPWEKIETICRKIYGADSVKSDKKVREKLDSFKRDGFGEFPVCIAKTQYSFSADPSLKGRPEGFEIPIRDVKLSAGAGFIVALAGEIMTMPGLPKSPAAERIDIDENGNIIGLS